MFGDVFHRPESATRGLVLPIVLVLLAGLWLLCISLLSLLVPSQRGSEARSDRVQADLAVMAGLEHVNTRLLELCASDDFLVIRKEPASSAEAPMLYGVRPFLEAGNVRFKYLPLFSTQANFTETKQLTVPIHGFGGQADDGARLIAHPWLEAVELPWIAIRDKQGRMVARYAYWLEDLEGCIDPSLDAVAMEGPIRLQAIDNSAGNVRSQELLDQRGLLLSPGSSLAVAGMVPPLKRWSPDENAMLAGRLVDPWAAFLESHAHVGIQAYEEQARVPFVCGLSPMVMGRPKHNLNEYLAMPSQDAVSAMANWMGKGLPDFAQRAGGFPEDYLQTLAANALDYADEDGEPRLLPGLYRGVDGQAFLSEVVLHLHFQGLVREQERWVLKWSLRLFAELWNMGSKPIEGARARLSYEVHLQPTSIGLSSSSLPFDASALLDDAQQSQHRLARVGERYFTPELRVSLRPDEYRFYEFAKVDYSIECQPQLDADGQPLAEWFDLVEPEAEARGLSLIWNGLEVERLPRLLRDPHGLANFRTDRRRKTAKACIPSLNYGGYGALINNPGDPRMSHYLRGLPLGENAYPENLSPHRRNIRRRNIYDLDPSPQKSRHYGRVMPSQWPDGGHDSPTGNFRVTTSDARLPTDPDFWPLSTVPTPLEAHAPQRLSNRGQFASACELGRVFDPLMWTPAYTNLHGQPGSGTADTAELIGRVSIWQRPAMPIRRGRWPGVSWGSLPSIVHGGGNSLRIGRPEHPRFDEPGMRASHLLDLFSTGPKRIKGRINLNTAGREVLCCLAYGALAEDDAIAIRISEAHDTAYALAPPTQQWQATDGCLRRVAEHIADGIIRARPFVSTSQLTGIVDDRGIKLFGNPMLHEPDGGLQWSDEAAEELFARVHDQSGVRSRNFRVWLVGQCLQGSDESLTVTAQSKRVMSVFVDPGKRDANGQLIMQNQRVRVIHECEF